MRSRTQKAAFNIISSAVTEIIALASTMILPRLILANYGSAYNGIASSVGQFLGLVSLLTLGVTAATRVALYKSLSKNDVAGTSAIVRSTELFMRRIGIILLAYIIGLAAIYPLVIKTGFSYIDVATLIVIIGASSFAEYYFGITYYTLLLADQCVYISNIFTAITTVLSLLVTIVLIKVGCSFQVVKLGGAAVYIFKLIAQKAYVAKHYQIDKHCKPDMTALKGRGDAMAHALANIVHDNTDIVILTLFTDVKTVSVYTIYNLVMNALKKLQLIFNTGTEPIFGSMWAKKEIGKIERTLGFYEFAVVAFCSTVFSTALLMLLPFVTLYTKGITDVEYVRPYYALAITLAYAVQCLRVPYLCVVGGIGHYKQTKKAAIWEAVINLGLSTILVNVIGMVGVAIGTLAANLYRTLMYATYIDNNVIKRGKKVYIKKMVWALCNIAVIVIPTYQYIQKFVFSGWLDWIICACAVFVMSAVVVVISSLIFYRKEFLDACQIVKRMALKTIHR